MAKLKPVQGPDSKNHVVPSKGWNGPDAPKPTAPKKKSSKKK